ncbi:hypothetical protein SAMN05444682_103200 [Parapedobacter indicus]|uniref:Uncharacterized protein n=1 Tax=Parapedobacter indicus TaxID=1477437 RepID=A0A1I3H2P1_9SPHI|nr:hypothetical protein CLV26_103201 [Parapedobacter indicus]SFI29923.1 hypothetical protein SAMN05444682_103200 [Parapedobacter indicus]
MTGCNLGGAAGAAYFISKKNVALVNFQLCRTRRPK